MTISPGIDLGRFELHHPQDFERALGEIRAGRKTTHWMWFILPQLTVLGRSSTAIEYGINSSAEAVAYLCHPVLGRDYSVIVDAIRDQVVGNRVGVTELMGHPDDLKLVSSLTLFGDVARTLGEPMYADLSASCEEVLGHAQSQGFAPCATTLAFLVD